MPETTEPTELSPKQAYDLTVTNPSALLVDIRSDMEFLFVGHPKDAVNIAWIDEPDWTINPNFTAEVRKLILGGVASDADDAVPVILVCRSGKRSMEAGSKLLAEGLSNIYSIKGGFEGPLDDNHQRGTQQGWRYDGLPWAQC
ncbi:MAG: rhodanese-related sulfurtransferase [Saprospiraceae bacterium]|jgi:rhodanese-related sulfurtransferase